MGNECCIFVFVASFVSFCILKSMLKTRKTKETEIWSENEQKDTDTE